MAADANIIGEGSGGHRGQPGSGFYITSVAVAKLANGRFRATLSESWGSNQGYLEEHGGNEVKGRGATWAEAISNAEQRARDAKFNMKYLAQAVGDAESACEDWEIAQEADAPSI